MTVESLPPPPPPPPPPDDELTQVDATEPLDPDDGQEPGKEERQAASQLLEQPELGTKPTREASQKLPLQHEQRHESPAGCTGEQLPPLHDC